MDTQQPATDKRINKKNIYVNIFIVSWLIRLLLKESKSINMQQQRLVIIIGSEFIDWKEGAVNKLFINEEKLWL